MPRFYMCFAGRDGERQPVDCHDVDAARNLAVQRLGSCLLDDPGFAQAGHWRVVVEDDMGRTVSTVIVATVTPRQAVE